MSPSLALQACVNRVNCEPPMHPNGHHRTRVIAEACANHLGDRSVQEDMIYAAAEAGADYIKFQSWSAVTNRRGQTASLAAYELSDDDHFRLKEVARKAGIGFASTVFDRQRLKFISSLDLDFIKVASPDCGSEGLLRDLAGTARKVILSTGMSEDAEVAQASSIFQDAVRAGSVSDGTCGAPFPVAYASGSDLVLLHCIYPLVDGAYNLRRMGWLRSYAPQVGLSDHSAGNDLRASLLAIALGADWLERHFILSRSSAAKDAAVSVDPAGLRELVQAAKHSGSGFAARNPEPKTRNPEPELMGEARPVLSAKVRELREFYRGRWGDNT